MTIYVRLTCPRTRRTIFCAWSTNCDAPRFAYRTLNDVREAMYDDVRHLVENTHPEDKYPEQAEEYRLTRTFELAKIERRIERLNRRGHTHLDLDQTGEEYVKFNRAGPREGQLTLPNLVEMLFGRLENRKRGVKGA